jgi:hypothetical protein
LKKKVSAEVAVFLGVDWRQDETVGYCEESTVIHSTLCVYTNFEYGSFLKGYSARTSTFQT